jgi:hypothetical protein
LNSIKKGEVKAMLYGAMNFPVKPILEELEAISELGFDPLVIGIIVRMENIVDLFLLLCTQSHALFHPFSN